MKLVQAGKLFICIAHTIWAQDRRVEVGLQSVSQKLQEKCSKKKKSGPMDNNSVLALQSH